MSRLGYPTMLGSIAVVGFAVLMGYFIAQPLDTNNPVLPLLAIGLVVLVVLRPIVGIGVLMSTLILSPLYPELAGAFTINRAVGILTLGGILIRKVTRLDKTRLVFHQFDMLFGVFFLIALVSIVINGQTSNTQHQLLELIMGYLFYWLITNTVHDWDRLKTVLVVIVVCCLGVAIGFFNLALTTPDPQSRYNLFGDATVNIYGNLFYLCISCLLMLSRLTQPRLLFYGLIPIFCLALALTGNRSGTLALFVSLLLYALLYGNLGQRARSLTGVVILVAIGILLANGISNIAVDRAVSFSAVSAITKDHEVRARLDFYQISINLFLRHPVLGIGLGRFGLYAGVYARVDASPHNLFLGTMAELGIVGFAILAAMYAQVFFLLHQARQVIKSVPGAPYRTAMLSHALIMFIGYAIVTNLTNGHTFERYTLVVFAIVITVAHLSMQAAAAPPSTALQSASG